MSELNHGSSAKSPKSSVATSSIDQADEAALALKSSVVADAHDLTDQAKHVAGDVMTHARKTAEAQISGGKDRVADSLGTVAEAIRQTGEQLRATDEEGLTEYAARAANQVEAAAEYLKERSIRDLLGDVGSFARREPAMFLGGAFVLGLVGGRFLKSSHAQPTPRLESSGASQPELRQGGRSSGRQSGPRHGSRSPAARKPSTSPAELAKPAQTFPSPEAVRSAPVSNGLGETPYVSSSAVTKPGAV